MRSLPAKVRTLKVLPLMFAIILFTVDRLTKMIAIFLFPDSLKLNPRTFFIFDTTAFSFILLTFLVSGLLWWFAHEQSIASACIAAGALSNYYDRIRYDAVIDWIPFVGVSIMNLADVSLIAGCAMILFSFFQKKKLS